MLLGVILDLLYELVPCLRFLPVLKIPFVVESPYQIPDIGIESLRGKRGDSPVARELVRALDHPAQPITVLLLAPCFNRRLTTIIASSVEADIAGDMLMQDSGNSKHGFW